MHGMFKSLFSTEHPLFITCLTVQKLSVYFLCFIVRLVLRHRLSFSSVSKFHIDIVEYDLISWCCAIQDVNKNDSFAHFSQRMENVHTASYVITNK